MLKRCDATRPVCYTCQTAGRHNCAYASDVAYQNNDDESSQQIIQPNAETSNGTQDIYILEKPVESGFIIGHRSPTLPSSFADHSILALSSSNLYSSKFVLNLISHDINDPYAFALSGVSLDDMNMKLYV